MQSDEPPYYNIKILADKTHLSPRNIRYYVQRGLLPKPEGGGRGYYYTDEHVQRIYDIKRWSKQGVPLEKIKQLLSTKEIPRINSNADTLVPDDAKLQHPKLNSNLILSDEKMSTYEPMLNYFSEEPETEISEWTRMRLGSDVEISFKTGTLSREDQQTIKEFILSRIKNK